MFGKNYVRNTVFLESILLSWTEKNSPKKQVGFFLSSPKSLVYVLLRYLYVQHVHFYLGVSLKQSWNKTKLSRDHVPYAIIQQKDALCHVIYCLLFSVQVSPFLFWNCRKMKYLQSSNPIPFFFPSCAWANSCKNSFNWGCCFITVNHLKKATAGAAALGGLCDILHCI